MLIFSLIFVIHLDALLCTGDSSDTRYTNSINKNKNGVGIVDRDQPTLGSQNLPPTFATYNNFVAHTTTSNSEDAQNEQLKTHFNIHQPRNGRYQSDLPFPYENKNEGKSGVIVEPIIQIGDRLNQLQQHNMTDAAKTEYTSLIVPALNNYYPNLGNGAVRIEAKPQYQNGKELLKSENENYNNYYDSADKKHNSGDDDQDLLLHQPLLLIVEPLIALPSKPDRVLQSRKDVKNQDDEPLKNSRIGENNEDIKNNAINNKKSLQRKDNVINRSAHLVRTLLEEQEEEEEPSNLDDIIKPEFESNYIDTKATKERVKYSHIRPAIECAKTRRWCTSTDSTTDDIQQESSWEENDMDFSYGDDELGPPHWSVMFKKCDGNRQSPINIQTLNLVPISTRPLRWNSIYFQKPKKMTLRNTGRELVLETCFPGQCIPKLSGGPLHKVYKLRSIKFHWGMNDSVGSEHQIDDTTYPMEIQAVHSCGSEKIPENVVIVAYVFQVGDTDSGPIEHILRVFVKALKHPERNVPLRCTFNLAKLLRPFSSEYMLYMGSFTTPPCEQGVKWLVHPYPLHISREQLRRFREVCQYAPKLSNNFRPVQPVCNRRVCLAV